MILHWFKCTIKLHILLKVVNDTDLTHVFIIAVYGVPCFIALIIRNNNLTTYGV